MTRREKEVKISSAAPEWDGEIEHISESERSRLEKECPFVRADKLWKSERDK